MQELNRQQIMPAAIEDEMKTSFIDYAMSVIKGRALPDVRDGLKPVHRRIIYAMRELNLYHNRPYLKSARIVGETMGKFHPHGDSAIYDTLVRMAQDFSMRAMLVDGQGNFGSVDGDSAAAMRYTEARMSPIAELLLTDIEKETIDFEPNYDDKEMEPSVLPSAFPNLLVNGSQGIAVGMATNIPPHNLGETIAGLQVLLKNPEATLEDIMEALPGPDFPTGGVVYDGGAVKEAYSTGRGSVTARAVAEIEEAKNGRFRIIITEIPYQVNKSNLINKIADLVRDKKITGISDIRDESSGEGIRVVIEIQKNAYPNKILNQLYKLTQLQENTSYNMIALVDGIQPRLLNLKNILEEFIKHRVVVITRRTEYELKIAKARAHILEGLRIALDEIDAVISTIRASKTKEDAKTNLIKKFKLSDLQAAAILDMRLQALAGLERQKIEDEYNEKLKFIGECEAILGDKQKVLDITKEELVEIKSKY
ncbi:MAG: DNA gyrase/topoisomerase IV subunit A, partial [Candidatus Sumerlaeota bacterium]